MDYRTNTLLVIGLYRSGPVHGWSGGLRDQASHRCSRGLLKEIDCVAID